MQYGKIEGLDKPLSRIIFGGSGKGMRCGVCCDEALDAAFAAGINTFDTARGYGGSERALGSWIARRGLRDKTVVITKGGLHGLLGNNRVNEKCVRADMARSLEALGLDCVDIYLLHRDNPKREAGEAVELLNDLRDRGYVSSFGVSNWRYRRIEQANEYAYRRGLRPLSVSEPHFSLAAAGRWTWIGCTSVTGDEAELKWYKSTGFPLIAFSPLGGGFMSGAVKSGDKRSAAKLSHAMRVTFASDENFARLRRAEELSAQLGCSVAQTALAWVLSQDMQTYAIAGSERPENIKKNSEAADIRLTAAQLEYLSSGK